MIKSKKKVLPLLFQQITCSKNEMQSKCLNGPEFSSQEDYIFGAFRNRNTGNDWGMTSSDFLRVRERTQFLQAHTISDFMWYSSVLWQGKIYPNLNMNKRPTIYFNCHYSHGRLVLLRCEILFLVSVATSPTTFVFVYICADERWHGYRADDNISMMRGMPIEKVSAF